MHYVEAMIAVVTRAEALREVQAHDASQAEFLREMGDHEEYHGGEVLRWLGY